MKKSQMFNILLAEVSEVCEVDEKDIINGCKLQSVVDARVLLVQFLRLIGLSNDDIAAIVLFKTEKGSFTIEDIKQKAKGVDKMYNAYDIRCEQSYAFCLMSNEIREFCRNEYRQMYVSGMKRLPA